MESTAAPVSYETGGLRVDVAQRVLLARDGQRIPLPSRAFELLLVFLRHPGELLDKNRLMAAVWPNTVVEENNLTQSIGALRRALGEAPGEHRFLVTEPGRGYRFVAAVTETRGVAAADQSAREAPRRLRRWGVPIAALLVAAAGLIAWWRAPSRPVDLSIAVMPLENHGEVRDTEYLALGIQDEILTLLTRVPDLRVVPRTSTLRYAQRDASVPQIGRALGVSYLLDGSVQRSGDRVRVHVTLIDAAADRHVWAQTCERPAADVFAIESEVAQSVAAALRVSLTAEQRRVIARPPTASPEAYDAYLRARASAERTTRTEAEIRSAIAYYEEAVRLDPGFAQAWAQLSRRHANFFSLAYDRSDARRAAAQRALDEASRLAPGSSRRRPRAVTYCWSCREISTAPSASSGRWRRVRRRAPMRPPAFAQILTERGELERSADYSRRVLALDALNPYRHSLICQGYATMRQLALALRTCERALELLPGDVGIVAIEASIFQAMGELERSRALLQTITPLPGDWRTLRVLSRQKLFDRAPADAVSLLELALQDVEALGTRRGVVRRWLADAYRLAGNASAARAAYTRAASEIEAELERQPLNPVLLAELATVRGRLGFYEGRVAPRAPVSRSRLEPTPRRLSYGLRRGAIPAELTAGDPARAVLALKDALQARGVLPPFTPALLEHDPEYDSLRERPDFRALLTGEPPGVAKSTSP